MKWTSNEAPPQTNVADRSAIRTQLQQIAIFPQRSDRGAISDIVDKLDSFTTCSVGQGI